MTKDEIIYVFKKYIEHTRQHNAYSGQESAVYFQRKLDTNIALCTKYAEGFDVLNCTNIGDFMVKGTEDDMNVLQTIYSLENTVFLFFHGSHYETLLLHPNDSESI